MGSDTMSVSKDPSLHTSTPAPTIASDGPVLPSSDTKPTCSDPPARVPTPAPIIARDELALPKTSLSMPAGDEVNFRSTIATISPSDDMRTWPMVRLHPDDAAAYLEGEIYQWFLEQGIDKKAEIEEEEMGPARRHIPWYLGGYEGARIDQIIVWHLRMIHEEFCDNPYGIPGHLYWIVVASMLIFMVGNILLGVFECFFGGEFNQARPLLQGALNAMPVIWVMTTFLFPALIANRLDQYAAFGHEVD